MSTKKKVDVAQKYISCRQKQDDAASKKHFVHKKVYFQKSLFISATALHTQSFLNNSRQSLKSIYEEVSFLIILKPIQRSFIFNNIEAKEVCNILNINEIQKQSPKSVL